MPIETSFAYTGFKQWLEHFDGLDSSAPSMPPALAAIVLPVDGSSDLPPAARSLLPLLTALHELQRAALNVESVADALRRYQKFAKPGQPSTHIVQLRQQQGAARQAASLVKQQFVRSAAVFVRDACIHVPERVALESFISRWILANVPAG